MVASFTIGIGGRTGEATLVLPFSSFQLPLSNAASPQLSESAQAKRRRAFEALSERLTQVPVDVGVRFTPLEVSSEDRSEEHTSELQSRQYLVCRLLLE